MGLAGSVYIWSIFNIPLAEAHGWDVASITFAYSLYLIFSAVAFFMAGALQQRFDPRAIAVVSGLVYGAGWFLAGAAQSLPVLYFGFGVLGGLGDGLFYNTALSVCQAWYPDRRGFASGVCVGAVGIVPMVFAPLGNLLIELFNVGMAFQICGVLFLLVLIACGPVLKMPPEGWAPEGWSAESEGAHEAVDLRMGQVVRTRLFWVIWVFMAFASVAGLMITAHASNIGQEVVGMDASQAALQVSILALANFAGRLGFGVLSDRIGRCNTLAIAMALTAMDLVFGFAIVRDFWTFSLVLAVAGACFGGVLAVMPALTADVFGSKFFSQNYALVYTGYTVASVLGPLLASGALSLTGSYQAAFTAAGAVAVFAMALALVMKRVQVKTLPGRR
ncbi:MAG: OFA family MFS transporter [Eggerthellaceae bacterium]|nr:OFA family MFS transporter [Eggerthellaceae bacterium]